MFGVRLEGVRRTNGVQSERAGGADVCGGCRVRAAKCLTLAALLALVAGCGTAKPRGASPSMRPSQPSQAAQPSQSAQPSHSAQPGHLATSSPTASSAARPLPTRMVLPATTAAVDTPFDISASGTTTGSDPITISISHNVGTITIGGRQLNAVSYFEQPWPEISLIPYQSVAVDSTGIHVFWIYCAFTHSDVSGTFTELFYESTAGGGMRNQPVTGTCTKHGSSARPTVSFPALNAPAPTVVGGYRISGANLRLDGAQPGTIRLYGSTASLYVFSVVDCSTVCGRAEGWYELHCIALSADGRVTFGILYLELIDRTHVAFNYRIALPGLSLVTNTLYDATWS